MRPFIQHEGVAVALRLHSISSDSIIPAHLPVAAEPTLLGRQAFQALRFTPDGREQPDFILNRPPYRQASILLAVGEFGAGPVRPAAIKCLEAFGIRVVIAPRFGEAFFADCIEHGLLPIVLPTDTLVGLMAAADEIAGEAPLLIDLPGQRIFSPLNAPINFSLAPSLKARLLASGERHDTA